MSTTGTLVGQKKWAANLERHFMKSLEEIHEFEKAKNWTQAINALEERLKSDPVELESVLRLAFLLWDLHVEEGSMRHGSDTSRFIDRTKELFFTTKEKFKDNSEYLFWFGLMISLFPWEFVPTDKRQPSVFGKNVTEWDKISRNLFEQASSGDPNDLWVIMAKRSLISTHSAEFKQLDQMVTKDRFIQKLTGRGFLGHYYLQPDW